MFAILQYREGCCCYTYVSVIGIFHSREEAKTCLRQKGYVEVEGEKLYNGGDRVWNFLYPGVESLQYNGCCIEEYEVGKINDDDD